MNYLNYVISLLNSFLNKTKQKKAVKKRKEKKREIPEGSRPWPICASTLAWQHPEPMRNY